MHDMPMPLRRAGSVTVVAKRGNIDMVVDSGVDRNDPNAKCILHNTLTGRKSKSMLIQRALKWGYWMPPKASVKIKRGS